jgi:hypothetical protein
MGRGKSIGLAYVAGGAGSRQAKGVSQDTRRKPLATGWMPVSAGG